MLNSLPISAETLLLAAAGLILLLLVLVLFLALRRRNDPALQSLAETLFRGQAELAGRLSQLSESTASQQSKIAGAIDEQRLSMLKMMDGKLLQVTKKDGAGGKKHPRNGFGKIFCQKKSDQKTAAGGAKGPKDRK